MAPQITIYAARNPTPADAGRTDGIVGSYRLADVHEGSGWLNSVTGVLFVCTDPAVGTWLPVGHPVLASAADPTAADDDTAHVVVGTLWRNTTTNDVFICVDPTTGAAVWQKLTLQPYMTNVQAADAAVAPLVSQSGCRFICSNAAAVTVTLPALAVGLVYEFLRAADEEMVVASAEGENMVVGNDLSADSITFTTATQQIGAIVRVEGILVGAAAKWLVTIPVAPYSTGAQLAIALAT